MRNNLLMTTALVAMVGFVHSSAAAPDWAGKHGNDSIKVTDGKTSSYRGDDVTSEDKDTNLGWYKDITVEKGGTLELSNGADLKTVEKNTPTADITIKGNLNMTDSILEAGNDADGDDPAKDNSNMLLDGATVTMTNSDLEANGNITINGGSLTSKTQMDDENKVAVRDELFANSDEDADDDSAFNGVWADKKLTSEGATVKLTNSYLSAGEGIDLKDGSYTLDNSVILAAGDELADISLSGGTYDLIDSVILGKDISLANTEKMSLKESDIIADNNIDLTKTELEISSPSGGQDYGLQANKDITIKDSNIKLSNAYVDAIKNLSITGSSLTLEDASWVGTEDGDVSIEGGEHSFNYSDILAENGGVTITGGKYTFTDGEIWGEKDVSISNASITFDKERTDNFERGIETEGNVALNNNEMTFKDSDIVSKTGNIVVNGGSLTVESSATDKIYDLHDDNGVISFSISNDNTSFHGVNVDKTASAENANITLTNSYLAAGEGVELTGGEYTLTNSAIIAGNDEKSSDVVISDSTLNLTDSVITGNNITLKNNTLNADKSDIVADQDIVFDGGEYTWTDSESTILSLNGNITVKSGNFYGGGDFLTPNGDVNIEGGYSEDDADDVNNGNWGGPDSDHLDIENRNLNIKGGTQILNNTNTTSAINNNISGGKVILNSGAITSWIGNINVSGGEIDISGNTEEAGHDIGLYARQQLNISDGTININGEGITIDNIADIFEDDYDTYDLNISGGTINVSGGTSEINEIASSKNINFTGGTINVNENSALGFAGGNDQIAATVITGKDAVLNISGKVDLGLGSAVDENDKPVDNKKGTLSGNGTINFLTSSANLNGDVSGVALAFETDNTLSTAITGTIEDAILNVNQGTLAVDKVASLNNLTVAENAGLTVKSAISTKTLTSSGTITGNSNSDITASGDLTVNGGSVNNDNSDLESWKTITIANTDVQLNNSADLTALEKLVIKDSQITAKNDDELWSLGDIAISGSTLDLTNSSINTLYENLDDIYAEQVSEPDTAGNITVSNTTLSLKNSNLESAGDIKLSSDTLNIDTAGTLVVAGNMTAENTEFNISEGAELSLLNTQEEASTLALNGGSINLLGTINGSLNGNAAINVLNSTNKIAGDVTLTDGGEMNIGTNKATIDGDAIFNSGSTVKMTVNSANEYGSLKANSVTGKEGAKLSLTVDNSIRDKITVKLFDTESMSDNFTREISNNRYTVTSDDGQSYDIEYTASASDIVADAGGTENNAQTAEAWDTIANDSHVSQGAKDVAHHLNDLSQHDAKKYNDALTALAPDAAPSVSHTSQQNTQQIFSAVGNRFNGGHMSGGHMGGPRGMSSGDVAGQRAAAWVQGLYNKAKLDDTSSSKGFDSKSYGTALGLETQYTDDVKLGIGYAYTKTDIDGFMRDTDVKTHTAILYGEYKPNNWYVNGVASYGWSDYSEDKNVSGKKVTADYDAETLGLQAITGYDIYLNNVTLSPEAGLRYVHVEQDRYTDSAGQSVSTDDSDILTGVIGVKAGTSYNYDSNVILKPEVRLAATYDLNNSDANSIVTLANGSGYKVNGDSLDRFGIETGVSVTANINEAIDVSLGYEGKFREDYQDHTGLINFKYNF